MTSTNDPAAYGTWDYRDTAINQDRDLVGYDVEATDGSIGKIDETSNEAGASHVVVDTGPWIFGTKRLIPAGAIESVDHERRVAYVAMTKEQIKSAPDYEREMWDEEARARHDTYYRDYINGGPGTGVY
ncbi:PRC-barrel domain containing protein [Ornithinimicrobium tianjinense]|uniref:PRC-barrel domain-containing protein n=1 Tax=Ornithinimicrobium tianjinense TaxID=1195761 RepID=A0A917F2Y4_9MICO|nr:PRC-barrel domain containing protein [Ornithinimicrobium tianjinense]GGF39724.1 hypothetical protein GCM10011366_04170 [Ornithinimicrobium tianjinense]